MLRRELLQQFFTPVKKNTVLNITLIWELPKPWSQFVRFQALEKFINAAFLAGVEVSWEPPLYLLDKYLNCRPKELKNS